MGMEKRFFPVIEHGEEVEQLNKSNTIKMKTYLCTKSEAESTETIDAFSAVDIATTPGDNDDNRCIIVVQDNDATRAVAKRFKLEDVSE